MLHVLCEKGIKYLDLLIYPPVAAVISGIVTWLCIQLLPRFGMVDIPHGRHDHAKPTPRGGGIAIIVAFFATAFIFALKHGQPGMLLVIGHFAVPAALLTVTGLIDDRYELPPWIKLAAQIAVGALIYYLGGGFYSLFNCHLPVYVGLPLTVCWVIGVINAFNLIDGLDGLAAGLSSVSSLLLAVWGIVFVGTPEYASLSLIFCGACIGFLIFNFSPAKIFMGDTGSMFLGLFFAFLCGRYASRSATLTALAVPLLAIGVPIFDVFLAIWRRLMRRIADPSGAAGIMSGDHDHLHHRLMKKYGSKSKTAIFLYLLLALVGVAGMGAVLLKELFSGAIYIVILLGVFLAVRLANIEVMDSFGCIVNGLKRPSHRLMLILVHPFIDFVLISCAYVVSCIFFFEYEPDFPESLCYVIFCLPLILILYCTGIYRTYWLRAGINRYYKFFNWLMIGGLFEFAILYVLERFYGFFGSMPLEYLYGGYLFFFMLVLVLVAGERFLVRYLESFGIRSFYLKMNSEKARTQRVVILGGGALCRLFIQNLFCRNYLQLPLTLVGIIDDDPAIRHLNVYGLKVLGSTLQLEKVYEDTPFEVMVITTGLSEKSTEIVKEFAAAHDVKLGVFVAETLFCAPGELSDELKKLAPKTAIPGSGVETPAADQN